jgi:tRNA-dihydrouridine synthase A
MDQNSRLFSIAPMMDWTDRHCRFFHRLMTRNAWLYTEMVTSAAVLHGDRQRLLGFDPVEQPVALQLGGSDPADLATAARIGADFGYAEINLNCGCPSDRVQSGAFGACLMREPGLVGDCVAAMKAAVSIPVTVKCRIGVDEQDPEEALNAFAEAVIAAGADLIIVHARKAWLKGLSPRENRDIPPLDYGRAMRLKQRFPATPITVNGGIVSLEAAQDLLKPVNGTALDGVMLGRAAYQNPGMLLHVDPVFYGKAAGISDEAGVVEAMMTYCARELAKGTHLSAITRHMLGLFAGRAGARAFRRTLAMQAVKPGAGLEVLREALACIRPLPDQDGIAA